MQWKLPTFGSKDSTSAPSGCLGVSYMDGKIWLDVRDLSGKEFAILNYIVSLQYFSYVVIIVIDFCPLSETNFFIELCSFLNFIQGSHQHEYQDWSLHQLRYLSFLLFSCFLIFLFFFFFCLGETTRDSAKASKFSALTYISGPKEERDWLIWWGEINKSSPMWFNSSSWWRFSFPLFLRYLILTSHNLLPFIFHKIYSFTGRCLISITVETFVELHILQKRYFRTLAAKI